MAIIEINTESRNRTTSYISEITSFLSNDANYLNWALLCWYLAIINKFFYYFYIFLDLVHHFLAALFQRTGAIPFDAFT
jgi:hypothetical protein